MNDFKKLQACSPFGLLACKIVEQAVLDYRALMRGYFVEKCSLEEIRRLLEGPWCEELLSFTDVDGGWVMAQIDRETEEIMPRSKPLTIDGRTENVYTWCKELGVDPSTVYRMYRSFGRVEAERHLAAIKKEKGI